MNSVFAGITIFILSIFMVAGGRRWISWFLTTRDPEHAERIERALDHIGQAVGAYFRGALLQATIAGLSSFIVLTILGVPFAAPLAVVVFFFDLIPVVGATLAAILVAVVTLFVNFPVALIVWVIFAIVYQQVENYVIQPQIQRRAVEIEPFTVLVAVLFGATLFGIIGALLRSQRPPRSRSRSGSGGRTAGISPPSRRRARYPRSPENRARPPVRHGPALLVLSADGGAASSWRRS